MEQKPKIPVQKLHTKQLLAYLKAHRKHSLISWHGGCCISDEEIRLMREPRWPFQQYTIEELKEELKTRPHIPNKREASALRRAKAKAGR